MMGSLLSIPAALGELWWLYDLGLAAAILVLIIILSFIKKQDFKKDGMKNLKNARLTLLSVKVSKPIRRRTKLITAENLLRSAVYNLGKYADKHDVYELKNKVGVLTTLQTEVGELAKTASSMSGEELSAAIDGVVAKMGE